LCTFLYACVLILVCMLARLFLYACALILDACVLILVSVLALGYMRLCVCVCLCVRMLGTPFFFGCRITLLGSSPRTLREFSPIIRSPITMNR